jgi:hypothetical protein
VMPMDIFKVILGKNFHRRMHSILIPWIDKMLIVGEHKYWVVRTTTQNSSGKFHLVYSLSMKRATRWNVIIYLCNSCWGSSREWSGETFST